MELRAAAFSDRIQVGNENQFVTVQFRLDCPVFLLPLVMTLMVYGFYRVPAVKS